MICRMSLAISRL